jgi:hypothetical protein
LSQEFESKFTCTIIIFQIFRIANYRLYMVLFFLIESELNLIFLLHQIINQELAGSRLIVVMTDAEPSEMSRWAEGGPAGFHFSTTRLQQMFKQ